MSSTGGGGGAGPSGAQRRTGGGDKLDRRRRRSRAAGARRRTGGGERWGRARPTEQLGPARIGAEPGTAWRQSSRWLARASSAGGGEKGATSGATSELGRHDLGVEQFMPERVGGRAARDRRVLGAEQAAGTSELVERRRKGASATSGRSGAVIGNEGPHCSREATATAHSSPFPIRMRRLLKNPLFCDTWFDYVSAYFCTCGLAHRWTLPQIIWGVHA
jgi:hypothetical protein